MPTFVTREVFGCGHAIETQDKSIGNDAVRLTETLPMRDVSCGACQGRELWGLAELKRYAAVWGVVKGLGRR